jgi:tRNA A-37 threonylcarbamoyl transferase component Bud32
MEVQPWWEPNGFAGMSAVSPTNSRGAPRSTVRVLKRDGRRGVFLIDHPDGPTVVKRWPLTPWELVKLVLGISQAQRQMRGARRLIAAGIRTPNPRGGVRFSFDGGAFIEVRLAWVEGEQLLERLKSADPAACELLGRQMGGLLRRLGAAGLFHRDAKLTNFIVDREQAIVAIDPVGVRWSRDDQSERERLRQSLLCELAPDEAARAEPFFRQAFGQQGRE